VRSLLSDPDGSLSKPLIWVHTFVAVPRQVKGEGDQVATTIESGFTTLLTRLTPSASESAAAKLHRATIKACLESRFEMARFFRTGSFGHGTSVRGYSDVDYFAVIPTQKLARDSEYALRVMKEALEARFPRTGVGVRTPAVRVPFGTDASEITEVLPADYVGTTSQGENVYDIPNRSGGWMRASPKAHNAYVDRIDAKHGGKVKPLIRFVKAWRFYRNVPIRSFYLELRVAAYADKERTIVYSHDVRGCLKYLKDTGLASIRDPVGVSGLVYGFPSDAVAHDALSKLETALARADKAIAAEIQGKLKDATDWWRLVYDDHFPAYG
jgi:hypothetical protein